MHGLRRKRMADEEQRAEQSGELRTAFVLEKFRQREKPGCYGKEGAGDREMNGEIQRVKHRAGESDALRDEGPDENGDPLEFGVKPSALKDISRAGDMEFVVHVEISLENEGVGEQTEKDNGEKWSPTRERRDITREKTAKHRWPKIPPKS